MKTRQYDLLRPRVGQKEPPRLGSTICYSQDLARKSHQDSAVRFVTATKTRQYDLLRHNMGQKEPPRLGSTICYGQTWARKSHQDSAVRFVTAKSWPEKPPRLGSTICYGQTWARKSHQDSAVRFVTAKRGPERATKTRQYDLLRPRVGQKEPPRLGSTICYGQELARKSHQDSAVRFVMAKSWPENATKTRQYDLLLPNVGHKEPPRLGSTICYGQELARKSHRDSAVRFVAAKRGPERATKTRSCHSQDLARKSHQDSAVRFVTAKRGPERATKTRQYDLLRPRVWPERATKTRQYDLLRPNVCQKKPPRLGSTICYGQELARKCHQDSAVRFVTAKRGPERATKTRQYDCYGQTWARKSHRDSAVRFVTAKRGPERATKTRQYDFVTAKTWPERATKTRQYDLLRPRVGQKMPPRLGSTICCGQELARKSHQDSAVRFVTVKRGPERATETRQYDLLRPNVGQKEPPRLGSTICYGQVLFRKSHPDSAIRFVTAKSWPEKATKTRQYDLLRLNVGQKEKSCPDKATKTRPYVLLRPIVGQKQPPRLGSTSCYGQTWARKSHQDSAVRFVTAKSWPERATETRQYDLILPNLGQIVTAKSWPEKATKTRQYDLLRPRIGQKEPPRLGSTIVTAKRGPERATKTRRYDLLRPNVGQKEPPRLVSTICYGQELARKSHRESAVRFVTAKRGPERAIKTRQYDLLWPRVGQKKLPRLGSTICYGQELARKSHQDSAVRFVTAKSWPERATKTLQYDLLRPNMGQKEPPRLGSTNCYGQELARK